MEISLVGNQHIPRKKEGQSRGTRLAITIDGPTNTALINAIEQLGMTKREYVTYTLIDKLMDRGFRYRIEEAIEEDIDPTPR